ncbi:hypothetical protein D9M70_590770 [compost metagenome]
MQLHVVGNVGRGDGDEAVGFRALVGDGHEAAADRLAGQRRLGGRMIDFQIAEREILREGGGSRERERDDGCENVFHGKYPFLFSDQEKKRRNGGTVRMTH